MSRQVVNLYEAKTTLSRLVDDAAGGKEVVIAKAGVPKVRLAPVGSKPSRRKFGLWKGRVRIAEDFDAPLPDKEIAAFEGGNETP